MTTELSLTERIDKWTEEKKPYVLDLIRIGFGIFLIWKGYQFGEKPETLPMVLGRFTFIEVFLIVYIVIAQIAAGVLILVGLITRTAIICILPIVIGAVIYSPRAAVHVTDTGELWALLVLALSATFLLYGSGAFSCDRYYRNHPPKSYI
jgi:uncharacterized membrane protein YphA (DoxX/SURF4 family)